MVQRSLYISLQQSKNAKATTNYSACPHAKCSLRVENFFCVYVHLGYQDSELQPLWANRNTVQVIPLEKNLGKENTEITDNQRDK